MNRSFNWGILGCGVIADDFCQSLRELEQAHLHTVASHSIERAERLAERYGAKACAAYDVLLSNPEIDIVYIATTHNFHFDLIRRSLEYGKHVLCEKPITLNAKQMAILMGCARKHKCFLMEAMWTRFLPCVQQLMADVDGGIIGELQHIDARFCIDVPYDAEHRLYNKALAGGALLDLGIYPIAFAQMLFKHSPDTILGMACMSESGVDSRSNYLLNYPSGKSASLMASCAFEAPAEAMLLGSLGRISVPDFFHAQSYCITVDDKHIERTIPYVSTGKHYEAQEVMEGITRGELQSARHSWQQSLETLKVMDTLRTQWGLSYPEETL